MAKSQLRLQARQMRRQGLSIRDITRELSVSQSSASRWCSDIELTTAQVERLMLRKEEPIRKGQLLGALAQKNKRLALVDQYLREGRERFKSVSDEEFFTAGLALYLAEGAKTMRQVHFVNADPRVVLFMMGWLQEFFGKGRDDFAVSVLINEMHRARQASVIGFWSRYLGMPKKQFRKTIFVKAKQQKVYENQEKYYGTLRFTVLKSSQLYYIISGLIEGLLQAKTTPV
jgi:hypothetical protein